MTRKKHWSRAKRVTNVYFATFFCLCNTCDSLGNSMYFMSQIDGSLVQIHTKFHDYSMLFIQVLFVYPYAQTRHGFYWSSSHGISMAWTRKWWDFPCGFGVTFDQAAVKETWENQCRIFYRDGTIYFYVANLLFRMEYDLLKSYIMYSNFIKL